MLRTRSAPLAAPALPRRAPARRALADHILSLQRTAGNRATRRLLQRDSRARTDSPWDRVWIGHNGLLGEVVEKGVTVRMFRDWKAVGIKQAPEAQAYECGAHDRAPSARASSRLACRTRSRCGSPTSSPASTPPSRSRSPRRGSTRRSRRGSTPRTTRRAAPPGRSWSPTCCGRAPADTHGRAPTNTKAVDALKGPADPKAALAALKKAGAPLDVSGGQGGLDDLLDPEKLAAPSRILCPKP